jgi:hypothetical protein
LFVFVCFWSPSFERHTNSAKNKQDKTKQTKQNKTKKETEKKGEKILTDEW